ncbi:Triphosphoribosyl-dephospho-CoA synthetase [Halorhabdus sp. SVX81]|uniref:triphosphoribosyl-dephospho-CoA synthase n=1 Tax=Halorhabdus sp. SVX81 TaxID=2978283 RepID=UPI0023DBA9AF|nr:triphosphoribosyl-dephospho-CoA synthase [Halorhabdus sp. SVX81]WEL17015.1 Triphosphoribosyl-dephospho-CoA synthetase [Halorhabdus sp. SVX81]
MTRPVAQQAELALLLEVATTPTPGNVDRHRDHDTLRFEHFLAGAVGASEGLGDLADPDGPPIGVAFEHAVSGMSNQSGGNTQFGGLLLLAPLVRAAVLGDLTPERATAVAEGTGVEDAAGFYRAFEHVDVAVADPPEDMDALDVRRGRDAVPEIRDRNLSLFDVLARSADHDGIAREWTTGFERTFDAADRLPARDGPLLDRAADVFLDLLAADPDTFVAINHGQETANDIRERAEAARDGRIDPETLADELVAEGINPGTTADILAGGLFVALERGAEV